MCVRARVIMCAKFACPADVHTRVLAGYLCYLIHARGRCGDVARIPHEPVLDSVAEDARGFLEVVAWPLYTSPSPRDRTRSRMPSSA